MEPSLIALIVIGGLVVIAVLWFVIAYNGLVRLRNHVKNAWSQIDVQLKRRHDLVPNLVNTVKGYATHEREALENVIEARSRAVSATSVPDRTRAEGELSGALGRLMLVVEQYPDLKANQNFLALQEELTATENRIGFSRQHYNDSVMTYNTKLQSLPDNIVAGLFSFKEEPFFEIEDKKQREVPQVSF
jgi:LemA protein